MSNQNASNRVGKRIQVEKDVRIPIRGKDDIIARVGDIIEVLPSDYDVDLDFPNAENSKMLREQEKKRTRSHRQSIPLKEKLWKDLKAKREKIKKRKDFLESVKANNRKYIEALKNKSRKYVVQTRSKKYEDFHKQTFGDRMI
jgi:hypothetical protein